MEKTAADGKLNPTAFSFKKVTPATIVSELDLDCIRVSRGEEEGEMAVPNSSLLI